MTLTKEAEETMNDYDKICNGCTTSISKQIELTKDIRRLKTLNNWSCIALSVAAVVITLLLRGK